MTNPDNSVVVIDKLFKFMKTTTDNFVRKDLATQISDLAYHYAPDRFWYIECMSKLFLRYAKYMDPKILQTVIVDVIGTSNHFDKYILIYIQMGMMKVQILNSENIV
jgi:hypothetical protein